MIVAWNIHLSRKQTMHNGETKIYGSNIPLVYLDAPNGRKAISKRRELLETLKRKPRQSAAKPEKGRFND